MDRFERDKALTSTSSLAAIRALINEAIANPGSPEEASTEKPSLTTPVQPISPEIAGLRSEIADLATNTDRFEQDIRDQLAA